MTAPLHANVPPAGHKPATAARAEMLDDLIAESAWSAGVACNLIATYIEIKDRAGLVYTVRQLIAHAKVIAQTTNDRTRLLSEREADEPAA